MKPTRNFLHFFREIILLCTYHMNSIRMECCTINISWNQIVEVVLHPFFHNIFHQSLSFFFVNSFLWIEVWCGILENSCFSSNINAVEISEVCSHSCFDKNFVKPTSLLKKLLQNWFHERKFRVFLHCDIVANSVFFAWNQLMKTAGTSISRNIATYVHR